MKRTLVIAGLAALAFTACKDKPGPQDLQYDRAALAAQVADQQVLPAYDSLVQGLSLLEQQIAAFTQAPDSAGLEAVRDALRSAWLQWQGASAFEFGPGATQSMRQVMNTFPADTTQVGLNIQAGTWDLNAANNLDARGFPALDFLLHGPSSSVAAFSTQPQATSRRAYLSALSADLSAHASAARTGWSSYAATFKAATGTDAGSATSLFVNQLNYDLEVLKNARIGIPLGKTTLGTPVPGNVECRYGGYSAALAVAQIQALRRLYLGESPAGIPGYSLKDALDAVEAQYNGGNLSTAITAQFDATISALQTVPDPLDETVVSAPASANSAYTEIQRLIVLTKTDMASNLGILITYTDNDGD